MRARRETGEDADALLHRRLLRRGHRLVESERLRPETRERLRALDLTLRDLALGEGAPRGFDPSRFVAPGVPRIRPLLVMLSEKAARPEDGSPAEAAARREGADHLALAVELLHVGVLVHDAALGRQGGRRRRAARRLLGGAVGWLGGNHLTLRALELARQAPGPEVLGDTLDALREVAEGHALAQSVRNRLPTLAECVAIAEGHTGALFSYACRAGARISGAERGVVAGLGRYGRHAGLAWHLAEDISAMELRADDQEDCLRGIVHHTWGGRPIYPLSAAAERDPGVGRIWLDLRRDGAPELALSLAERVAATGAIGQTRERLALECWQARKALQALPPSPERDALDHIARTLAA
jgi:geranylgeranyl pyrophosphate synthase